MRSLNSLEALGISVEEQLNRINSCLSDIDQLFVPSTINNIFNKRFILRKERDIISTFEEAEPKALNYIVQHCKLGLLFYKVKDHRHFRGLHRTELIELLAVTRISVLTILSRVLVLHALQMMKLPANSRSEYWVRNILLRTSQDDLSELKCLTDAKGDYFCMNKLIYSDIRSESVRNDILKHFGKEAKIQAAHMSMKTKKSKLRAKKAWRKILSDVDDTLYSSGGSYPAGIDKKYSKKVLYPGVLAFYRELDLGTQGPEEWPAQRVGNLVFLSARPHVYKDVSEKHNYAKFRKLKYTRGMHTIPSLLPGDMASGGAFVVQNDMEPLAVKKFNNFKEYVSIYPEFQHVFIGDNGQGDLRAGELMYDAFPHHLIGLYIHVVQPLERTHGFVPERYRQKKFKPCFFKCYPEAALHAGTRKPVPLIRPNGVRRICTESVQDFEMIEGKKWKSRKQYWARREELNQAIWRCNVWLLTCGVEEAPYILAKRIWKNGDKVSTKYGVATITSFDPIFDMYGVELDWRPLNVQVEEHQKHEQERKQEAASVIKSPPTSGNASDIPLETVLETADEGDIDDTTTTTTTTKSDSPPGFSRTNTAALLDDQGLPLITSSESSCATTTTSDISEGDPHKDALSAIIQTTDLSSCSPDKIGTIVTPPSSPPHTPSKPPHASSKRSLTPSSLATPKKTNLPHHIITATLHRSAIMPFSPPKLPDMPTKYKSPNIFSFWTKDATAASTATNTSSSSSSPKKNSKLKVGDKVTTPYGDAIVKDVRNDDLFVLVDFTTWNARGYLHQDIVKVVDYGLLANLFRRSRGSDGSTAGTATETKDAPFPYTMGSTIRTPFGDGEVSRPFPTETQSADETQTSVPSSETPILSPQQPAPTIAINLTSWRLADDSHPVLYCTFATAQQWKNDESATSQNKGTGGSLFSVLGLVSSGIIQRVTRTSTDMKLSDDKTTATVPPPTPPAPVHEQYYKNGSTILTTPFGKGIVQSFRPDNGFYTVRLCHHAVGYFRQDSLTHFTAPHCHEGYPVLTSFGAITGTLASVVPQTSVHIVTTAVHHPCRMACYLQPGSIVQPLKACVGEEVLTPFGEGIVRGYRREDNIYRIQLGEWGQLYAHGERFDRVYGSSGRDEIAGRGGDGGGISKWLLRYLWFGGGKEEEEGEEVVNRSRSNSVVSLSV
eukprot:CAMPEP_0172486202 /NCGR_PEP_ID=MMETSP1066-20121228/14668_1 /TAXON_ID=671091 /ORGANISM="Coscinodiscus wailesii, Strain CCMP2513" /LENGTH=1174 /DNA_ID=CAMNT_0013251999 /DNA_START=498 /DNA_END=4019 /DNA_ORIENTATION=+